MNLARTAISLFFTTTLSLMTACNAASPPPVTPTPTATPVIETTTRVAESNPVETASPTPTPTSTLTQTPLPEPTVTNTLVPTITPTQEPTPEPEPMIQVDERLTTQVNVRAGPGTNYPRVTKVEPGGQASVVGRNEDNSWWQISLTDSPQESDAVGWIFGELVTFSGNQERVAIVNAPPLPPTATREVEAETADNPESEPNNGEPAASEPEELADQLRCGKDFCVTYQAMVPIWENAGCIGNHSIYITVLEGLPPGKPMDGVVIGDTFNNVEVGSGSHGPGRTEITLWNNSMTLIAKRHMDGTPYTSEESFNFTSHDELIPAEVLAANGYCEGQVDKCREAQQNNQVCRGHYSWRVTFHKFD